MNEGRNRKKDVVQRKTKKLSQEDKENNALEHVVYARKRDGKEINISPNQRVKKPKKESIDKFIQRTMSGNLKLKPLNANQMACVLSGIVLGQVADGLTGLPPTNEEKIKAVNVLKEILPLINDGNQKGNTTGDQTTVDMISKLKERELPTDLIEEEPSNNKDGNEEQTL